uniref:Uncharacterized protein n=1 Tax=viral metagenome TaxID=1070528 RepID=A0A6H2A4F6_9ZZZZ
MGKADDMADLIAQAGFNAEHQHNLTPESRAPCFVRRADLTLLCDLALTAVACRKAAPGYRDELLEWIGVFDGHADAVIAAGLLPEEVTDGPTG